MRLQDSQVNCGPTALYNALTALGIRRSPKELDTLCGVTTEGTSDAALLIACTKIRGLRPRVLETTNQYQGLATLRDALRRGRPVVLAVDQDEHYVAAVGLLGERVLVADGARADLVIAYPDTMLANRWGVADASTEPTHTYWGIIL